MSNPLSRARPQRGGPSPMPARPPPTPGPPLRVIRVPSDQTLSLRARGAAARPLLTCWPRRPLRRGGAAPPRADGPGSRSGAAAAPAAPAGRTRAERWPRGAPARAAPRWSRERASAAAPRASAPRGPPRRRAPRAAPPPGSPAAGAPWLGFTLPLPLTLTLTASRLACRWREVLSSCSEVARFVSRSRLDAVSAATYRGWLWRQ